MGARSRTLAAALELIGWRIKELVAELAGNEVTEVFANDHAPRLLDARTFDRKSGTSVTIYLPRNRSRR